jgi:hypothetical protein
MPTRRKAEVDRDEWVTLNAAAAQLGESRLTTLHRIVKGELEGKHIAGRTVVRHSSLASVLETRAA